MKNQKGFTLVELIVVIAVLLLVLGTAVGIFISIVQHQRIILAEQELLNQFSYAIDHMSKALRMAGKSTGTCMATGSNYELTKLPDVTTNNYTGIKFINQSDNDACQEFYVEGGILKERKNDLPAEGVALTSSKFNIKSIRFGINGGNGCSRAGCVAGASEEDNTQSRVTIYLDIQISGNNERPSKKIQTTISQRNLNTINEP